MSFVELISFVSTKQGLHSDSIEFFGFSGSEEGLISSSQAHYRFVSLHCQSQYDADSSLLAY